MKTTDRLHPRKKGMTSIGLHNLAEFYGLMFTEDAKARAAEKPVAQPETSASALAVRRA